MKIPVTNTTGDSSDDLVRELLRGDGVKLNVTALMTLEQVATSPTALAERRPAVRLGLRRPDRRHRRDPVPLMAEAVAAIGRIDPKLELIWASPREVLNIVQADAGRLPHHHRHPRPARRSCALSARTSTEFSLETVKMFHDDAAEAGYSLG